MDEPQREPRQEPQREPEPEGQRPASAGPHDLQERLRAVEEQIRELHRLNHEFGKQFDHLSLAIRHGWKEGKIDSEELARLVEVNGRANAAKHERLGLGQDGPGPVRLGPAASGEAPLGNHIGELERAYALRLGRPLRKNEPRYRFQPRMLQMGDFVSIVCLDALEPPVEFFGDAYRFKQSAKHSAALQAVLYLGAAKPREPAPLPAAASTSRAGPVRPAGSELFAAREAVGAPADAGERWSLPSGMPEKCLMQDLLSAAYGMPAAAPGTEAAGDHPQPQAAPQPSAAPAPAAWKVQAPCAGGSAQAAVAEAHAAPPPAQKQENAGCFGGPVMPPDEAILQCLRQSQRPLAVREVYLLSLGRDPGRDQMGAGVKAGMNRRLYALQAAGRICSSSGLWSSA